MTTRVWIQNFNVISLSSHHSLKNIPNTYQSKDYASFPDQNTPVPCVILPSAKSPTGQVLPTLGAENPSLSLSDFCDRHRAFCWNGRVVLSRAPYTQAECFVEVVGWQEAALPLMAPAPEQSLIQHGHPRATYSSQQQLEPLLSCWPKLVVTRPSSSYTQSQHA